MNGYLDLAPIKGEAREQLAGRYGVTVKAYIWMNMILLCITWLSMSVLQGLGGRVFSVILYLIQVCVSGILSAGSAYLYLNLVSGQHIYTRLIFYCFKFHTEKAVAISLYKGMLEIGVSLLFLISYYSYLAGRDVVFFIPMGIGAIIMLAGYLLIGAIYMPAYYLIHDFPDRRVTEIIKLCPVITRGWIGNIIILELQFIPLKLLEILSLGVGSPWAESYISAICAKYYIALMKVRSGQKVTAQGA